MKINGCCREQKGNKIQDSAPEHAFRDQPLRLKMLFCLCFFGVLSPGAFFYGFCL